MIAVSSGFLSITDDRVLILSREAAIGGQVDRAAAQSRLDAALEEAGSLASGEPGAGRGEVLPGAAPGRGRAVLTRASAGARR